MEGIIVNYRRGRHTQKTNQMIVFVENSKTKEDAKKLVSKKVTYENFGKKKIKFVGEIRAPHGNSGCVRVLFEKGLPGQAIGSKVVIN